MVVGWGPYAYFIAQEEFYSSRDNAAAAAAQSVVIVDAPIAGGQPRPFHNQTYHQMEMGAAQ